MKNSLLIVSFASSITFAAPIAQRGAAVLALQLRGNSGSSISTLNSRLKELGEKQLPQSIELSSIMTDTEVLKIKRDLDDLVDKASRNEMIDTSAYGDKINGKSTCFKGNNKKVADIYGNMVDNFVSDQFTIIATATKQPDRVGIKFDESDSGSAGSWINISICK